MRISELIIRLIDWFYRKPVAAILPRQTFRYIVCGGANVVFSWVCYFLVYNFVLDKEQLDLGFVVVSAYVATMLLIFPFTFFTGFWLNRYLTFRHSVVPLPAVDRRLGGRELCRVEIFRGVLRIVGHAVADAGDFRHDDLQLSGRQILHLPPCGGLTPPRSLLYYNLPGPVGEGEHVLVYGFPRFVAKSCGLCVIGVKYLPFVHHGTLREPRPGILAGEVLVDRRFENGDFTAFRAVLFCGSSRFRSLP